MHHIWFSVAKKNVLVSKTTHDLGQMKHGVNCDSAKFRYFWSRCNKKWKFLYFLKILFQFFFQVTWSSRNPILSTKFFAWYGVFMVRFNVFLPVEDDAVNYFKWKGCDEKLQPLKVGSTGLNYRHYVGWTLFPDFRWKKKSNKSCI